MTSPTSTTARARSGLRFALGAVVVMLGALAAVAFYQARPDGRAGGLVRATANG